MIQSEGYVVRDKNFVRVKVKTPQYVALVNLSVYDTQGLNFGHMLRIIRASEGKEVVSLCLRFSFGISDLLPTIQNLVSCFEEFVQAIR